MPPCSFARQPSAASCPPLKDAAKIKEVEENEEVIDLLQRAEAWLKNNDYNTPIYKWNTPLWGEIPADFGRK